MLQRLNEQGALNQDATGINPPIVRAVTHVGYAVAVASITSDGAWTDNYRVTVRNEIIEAKRHLQANLNTGFTATPFLSDTAIEQLNVLVTQFDEVIDTLGAAEVTKDTAYSDLTILADNAAYISAVAENYVIGNGADEGRNP